MGDTKFLIGLGARIRKIRREKDMTQNELAFQCNFEKATMSRIESGKSNVTVLTLKKIGKALDVEIKEFFKE